jgi:recombination protein RecT
MTNTEVATTESKPMHPMVQFRSWLDARLPEIKTALPAHISPERFIRVILTAAQINPEIIACDRLSLWNACMRAANDGLLPDGVEGAIVPFKNKATWIPMYAGLLKLFRNSGQFKHINTGIVYQGEEFTHWVDEDGEHFRHVPGDERDPKKIRRVYATATTKDGGFFISDLSLNEVNKHKAMSRAGREDAPWRQWEQEMQRKTALRVLSKLLPKSSDLDALIRRDEEALYGVEAVEERRQSITRPVDTASALDAFGASAARPSVEEPKGGGQEEDKPGEDTDTVAARQEQASSSDESPPAPTDLSTGEIKAFERGKQDHAKGISRRTVPGDLRLNSKLALAWVRGWETAE